MGKNSQRAEPLYEIFMKYYFAAPTDKLNATL